MKLVESVAGAWNRFFFSGFSDQSLGLLRIYFGCGLLLFHVSQFPHILALDPLGPAFRFTVPMWHFELLGIHTHVPWLTPVVFLVMMLATVAMTLGRWTRPAIILVILCVFYLKGVRDSFAGDVHHRYLMPMQMLVLLLVSRCGEVRSWDARRRAGVATPAISEWQASWPIKTMQIYVASFYFWSVVAKLRVSGLEWFIGGGKIQEILISRAVRWSGVETRELFFNPLAFEIANSPLVLHALGLLTLLMEMGFPLILLITSPRWRLVALLAVAGFHIVNFVLLSVMFLMIPIVFFVFFDLAPVQAWLSTRLRRTMRTTSGGAAPAADASR